MKTTIINRTCGLAACVLVSIAGTSCVTTYDAAGRPVQTVDPMMAAAGVAAAGLVGYAIGQDHDHGHHHYHGGGYYGGYAYNGYRRGYHRPYCR